MTELLIGAIITVGLTALSNRVLARMAPPSQISEDIVFESESRYLLYDLATIIGFIFFLFLFTAALTGLLVLGSRLRFGLLPDAEFTYTIVSMYWAIPAFFLGMVLAGMTAGALCKLVLRERYPAYLAHSSREYKYDVDRAARYTSTIATSIGAVLVVLGMDCFVQLRGNTLAVNRLLSFGDKQYELDRDVISIVETPGYKTVTGKTVERPDVVLTFRNGDRWALSGIPTDLSETEEEQLVLLLAERAGVSVSKTTEFERLPFFGIPGKVEPAPES